MIELAGLSRFTGLRFIGNGAYRDVFISEDQKTVIKRPWEDSGRRSNRREVYTFEASKDVRKRFTFEGKRFKVRLAEIVDYDRERCDWLQMEYVPNVGKIHIAAGVGVCFSCSGDTTNECDWDRCFTCVFNEWCQDEFGIFDVHMCNFGYQPGRKEIVIVDYGDESFG